jgi:ParB family chromosome partitioning protein
MSDTPPRTRGLGRGLSALIGDSEPLAVDRSEAPVGPTATVPIELVRRNADQPRRHFDETDLEELAGSIRERGVLVPILVRPMPGAPGEYQIVAGERRWRAAQRAGLHQVPVVVRSDLDDLTVLEIAIIENVQRADLGPLEEAQGYKALIERFGRTQDEVARTVGKSRSHVANLIRLLALPEPVREHLAEGRLTAGHARALLTAADPEGLAKRVIDGALSVRQTEELARKVDKPRSKSQIDRSFLAGTKDPDTRALEQDLSDSLGYRVSVEDRNGQGEVRIAYKSLEQLDEICRRLTRT